MKDFIAFDVETTGIEPSSDVIIELGAVRFVDGEPSGQAYSTLINPERPIPEGASKVNGITDMMVRNKPLIKDVLEPFAEYCGDLPLVAHNAKFDFDFMLRAVKQHQAKSPAGTVVDNLALARRVVPGLHSYRLEVLIRHFKIQSGTLHRAEDDAALCGKVFSNIIKGLDRAGHSTTLEAVLELTGKQALVFPQYEPAPEQLGLF